MRRLTTLALLALAARPLPAQDAPLARGDAAWERRNEGAEGRRAAAGPIGEAVAAYVEALDRDPASLEARWKLLRALYFQGDHTSGDRETRKGIFGRGREVAEQTLDLLAARVGGRDKLDAMEPEAFAGAFAEPEAVARIYFWAAANWGLWGSTFGKLAAARQGVAGRVRDYARVVIALDPSYEGGAGHRMYGRLHTEAPKIPFVTGWIDREVALEHTRRAYEIDPDHPDSMLFYADALLRFDKTRREEALAILGELAAGSPRPSHAVEDATAIAQARDVLAEHGNPP